MQPQKIISVSGLYSGIGKTELCCRILALLPGMCAVKITINDHVTEVIDDEASIMVTGKDTWRLKTSGAAQVLWVRAQEACLEETLAAAVARCGACERLLIEGNSMLAHLTADLSIFICDSRICAAGPPKPSRAAALAKADVIINNLRGAGDAAEAHVEQAVRRYNRAAPVVCLDITDRAKTDAMLQGLLRGHGFLM
jgi:Ni2+-binding GTPase involved in maturation of urease and hydrogenase